MWNGSGSILAVLGTRPEAIKLAPVIRALEAAGMGTAICNTGQHREMLPPLMRLFGLRARYSLNLMRPDQDHVEFGGRLLMRLARVLERERPQVLLVQGDTTSAAMASLAAFYRGIPVAHVEAGLRTWRREAPFPEEGNRQVIGVLADLHCAPTEGARNNLVRSGIDPARIVVTGNPVIDALLWVRERLPALTGNFVATPAETARILLVTAHRREHFGEPLRQICQAIRTLAEQNPDVEVIFPVHLNPNVQGPVRALLGGAPRIHLVPPLDYPCFVQVLSRCVMVLTDSGGIQEEAPALGKPVLVLRDRTERPEGVAAGTARIVGWRSNGIVREAQRLLNDPSAYEAMARAVNPYGDGRAAGRIVGAILARFPRRTGPRLPSSSFPEPRGVPRGDRA